MSIVIVISPLIALMEDQVSSFTARGHTKYGLKVIYLLGAIKATVSPRLPHQITWCHFVNTQGGLGKNVSMDLHMEHLNRTLKDYLTGLDPNISEAAIIQTSKLLRKVMEVTSHFDSIFDI